MLPIIFNIFFFSKLICIVASLFRPNKFSRAEANDKIKISVIESLIGIIISRAKD